MPAHDFSGSLADLQDWLSPASHLSKAGYHLLVGGGRPVTNTDPAFAALKEYLESAHADAREHFHQICKLDLHPMAHSPGGAVEYPNRLVGNVRRGLFGEALCGAVAECWFLLHFQGEFDVPVFLFRFHSGVEEELAKLLDGGPATDFAGRHGDDFLAVELGADGEVVRILVGEAKFRTKMGTAEYDALMKGPKGVLSKLSAEPDVPLSINKLSRLLGIVDSARFEKMRASLDEIYFRQRKAERVDMVVLVYESHAVQAKPPYAPKVVKPAEHTVARPLVIAELHIPSANALLGEIYPILYRP
jgi:hypothetical protein